MASFEQHLNQARHNEHVISKMAESCPGDQSLDWYTTVTFYAALHYIEAALARVKPQMEVKTGIRMPIEHSTTYRQWRNAAIREEMKAAINAGKRNAIGKSLDAVMNEHAARKKIILDTAELSTRCHSPYHNLQQLCHAARYSCYSPKVYNSTWCDDWINDIRTAFMDIANVTKQEIENYPLATGWVAGRPNCKAS